MTDQIRLIRRALMLRQARRSIGPRYEKTPDQKQALTAIDQKLRATERDIRAGSAVDEDRRPD